MRKALQAGSQHLHSIAFKSERQPCTSTQHAKECRTASTNDDGHSGSRDTWKDASRLQKQHACNLGSTNTGAMHGTQTLDQASTQQSSLTSLHPAPQTAHHTPLLVLIKAKATHFRVPTSAENLFAQALTCHCDHRLSR